MRGWHNVEWQEDDLNHHETHPLRHSSGQAETTYEGNEQKNAKARVSGFEAIPRKAWEYTYFLWKKVECPLPLPPFSPFSGPSITFPLPNNNSIEIRLSKPVSKKDFERIKKLVDLSEDSLVMPDDDDLGNM